MTADVARKLGAIGLVRRYPGRFLALFLCVTFLLLDMAAGTVARALHGARSSQAPSMQAGTMVYRYATPYHHDLKTDLDTEAFWGPISYRVITNAFGFKSSATGPLPDSRGRSRILVLGDSFVEGVGVAPEELFTSKLEKQLPSVQVLNAGVTSYAPIIYYRKLRFLLEDQRLIPDAVVVFIDLSDIQDEAMYYTWGPNDIVVDSYGRIEYAARGIDPLTKLPQWDMTAKKQGFWRRNTLLIGGAISLVENRRGYPESFLRATGFFRALWTLDEHAWADYGEAGLTLATRHMDLLADYLRDRGIPLTVVVYPWPDQIVNGDLDSRQVRHWRGWAHGKQVDFLNLFPLFIAETSASQVSGLFFAGDEHWSAAGHVRVADALARHLRKRKHVTTTLSLLGRRQANDVLYGADRQVVAAQ